MATTSFNRFAALSLLEAEEKSSIAKASKNAPTAAASNQVRPNTINVPLTTVAASNQLKQQNKARKTGSNASQSANPKLDFKPHENSRVDPRNKGRPHGSNSTDRQNRSGRVDGEKKQYHGKGNWGKAITSPTEAEAAAAGEPSPLVAEDAEAAPAEEAQPKTVTLDQYLANKAQLSPNLPTSASSASSKPRSIDPAQLKNAVPLSRDGEGEYFRSSKKTLKNRK